MKIDTWDDFKQFEESEKADFFKKDGRIFHVIFSQQFDKGLLVDLFDLADKIRAMYQSKGGVLFLASCLYNKRAMLYFTQPSTRTFLSFLTACEILGMKCSEVRISATSSEFKGESQEDSVRTFSVYHDLIILRHSAEKFAEKIAFAFNMLNLAKPVFNGGSGMDQHPTQALLDIYTLHRCFQTSGGIEGKKIMLVGDLARGRAARSLTYLLAKFHDVQFYFVAPSGYQMKRDILDYLEKKGERYILEEDFEKVLPTVDTIYMTRIQDEYDIDGESARVDFSKYHLMEKHLSMLKPEAVILHPLPRRKEIESRIDSDPRAKYWEQVENGMWIRVALIAYVFRQEEAIHAYYHEKCCVQ